MSADPRSDTDNTSFPRLVRTAPRLPDLGTRPSWEELAKKYATMAEFIAQQWPVLVASLDLVSARITLQSDILSECRRASLAAESSVGALSKRLEDGDAKVRQRLESVPDLAREAAQSIGKQLLVERERDSSRVKLDKIEKTREQRDKERRLAFWAILIFVAERAIEAALKGHL